MSQRKERRQQSIEELALTHSMLSEGSTNNVIAYSSISADATAYDQQYTRYSMVWPHHYIEIVYATVVNYLQKNIV